MTICGGVIAAMAGAIVATLCLSPDSARADRDSAPDDGNAAVAAAKAERDDLKRVWIGQAEFRPYQEIELHPKVAGYLQSITVDVGDRLNEGQVIATLEVPELDDDLTRAEAVVKRSEQEVARAQASADEAQGAFERLQAVVKSQPKLIAQQDLDSALAKQRGATSNCAAAKEQLAVSQAEAKKLHTMKQYTRITVPFAGVVTKRYADPGQIIQAGTGSSTQTTPLVRLSTRPSAPDGSRANEICSLRPQRR
jgi:multidrug efflux pump subunit AcrA (membrane-fusion protein)